MELLERTLLAEYKGALDAFLARPEDERLRAAYDAVVTALGARYRVPAGATEFSIECIAAFELALQDYERALIASNSRTITLIESNKKLRDSNAELDSFASTAAHDLRAPLRNIIGFGSILKQRAAASLPPPAADALDRIQASAARMDRLIDGLLAYSRTASSGVVPQNKFNLRIPAEEAVLDLELLIQLSGAKIEISHLDDISGDQVQIRQLFQNLISNAIKFHRAEAKPEVYVASVRTADGHIELCVRDKGIGFEEKYLQRILKPFQRLNSVAEFEGSGLGLAICAKIIARHGATISALSSPGKGAQFTVAFPAI